MRSASVDYQSYVAFVIEVVGTLGLSVGPKITWDEITLESTDEPITTRSPRIIPECSTALVTVTTRQHFKPS
jgi:hypothetical protein